MEYIAIAPMEGMTASGRRISVRKGEVFPVMGRFIATPEGRGICYTTSEQAHRYFARNDDGRGLERGSLTHAIAYKKRVKLGKGGNEQRFSDKEIKTLCARWEKYLVKDVPVILFNHEFFNLDVETLREIAASLHIKP